MKATKITATATAMNPLNTVKKVAISAAIATALAAGAVATTPATALANDYDYWNPATTTATTDTAQAASHYEGEPVVIDGGWSKPVYAEWHKGDSGKWWATFFTYNYNKIYAEPAGTGNGWIFHAYDANGNFQNVYRCDESSTHGEVGSQGVSSHWTDAFGNWY